MNGFAGYFRITPRSWLSWAAGFGSLGAGLLGLLPEGLLAAGPVMQAAPAAAPALVDEAREPDSVAKPLTVTLPPKSGTSSTLPATPSRGELPTIVPPGAMPGTATTKPNAPAAIAAPGAPLAMPAATPIAAPSATMKPEAAPQVTAGPSYSRTDFQPAGPVATSAKAEQYGFSRGPKIEGPAPTTLQLPSSGVLPPVTKPGQASTASPIPASANPGPVTPASVQARGVTTTLPLNLAPTRPATERPAPVPQPSTYTLRTPSTGGHSGTAAKPASGPAMLRIAPAVAQLEPEAPAAPGAIDPLADPAAPGPVVPLAPQPMIPVGPPMVLPAAPAQPLPIGPQVIDDHFEQITETGTLEVSLRRSVLIRSKSDIYRTAVVDPQICDIVQFTPREVSIIGKGQGATSVTFWFNDGRHLPVTYIVKVKPDLEERRRIEGQYKLLQDIIREQFPDSKVYLIPVADKLIVRGQAKDGEEAAQIMAIIRGQSNNMSFLNQSYNLLAQGAAAQVLTGQETGRQAWPRMQVINMLRVPGIQQVALRVKIAELNRTAARGFGVDVKADIDFSGSSALLLNSVLNTTAGGSPALLAQFDGDDVQFGVRYLQQHGVVRVLSEPTLVTMSGRPATFVAGGEFAVPTIVGSAGLNAVTTDFRAFGVIISFVPTVLDKDRIQLQVAPEFSQINSDNSVNNVPGLNVRAVTTTVEMREGQTLAIAGLLDDSMKATNVGDLPFLAQIFGHRDVTRSETELIILVTPELVHPMEPEEVPPLPGFDVTEPNNHDFFFGAQLEGDPTQEYRSTIWHKLRSRYVSGGSGMISGQFGHGG